MNALVALDCGNYSVISPESRRKSVDVQMNRFEIDEVSAGVYEVIANDKHGRRFSEKDTDPDVLLEKCRQQAKELEQKTPEGCLGHPSNCDDELSSTEKQRRES